MAHYCISLIGGKSGVGTSVCAINLATSLYRETKGKVLLLDFNILGAGDSSLMLGGSDMRPLTELLPVIHKLNSKNIENYISKHKSGIWVLPAINQSRQINNIDAEKLQAFFKIARKTFHTIVVDCGSQLNHANIHAISNSSAVFVVVAPQILTINSALQNIRDITTLQYPQELIQVLINRYTSKTTITEAVIQKKLKRNIVAVLPEDSREIDHSIHQGMPIVINQTKSEFAKSVENLSHRLFSSGMLKKVNRFDLRIGNVPLVHFGSGSSSALHPPKHQTKSKADALEYDRLSDLKMKAHSKLIEALNLKNTNISELSGNPERLLELKEKARDAVAKIVQNQEGIRNIAERHQISKEVLDEALGLGPLEDLLADNDVSEIMVNRKDQIYIEKDGKLIHTNYRFTSNKHLLAVIERIVAPIGRRIDEKTPMVDARLQDGSRVHAIIPPLAINGPMLTIRKFGKSIINYHDLVKLNALTDEMADFLRSCIKARLNIIISGGTGTGKTTLLNVLSSFIPDSERILTIEDAAELQLPQEHVGRLESRPANLQGDGAIPIRELVRNALRMRPDRIIVGECRGAEALDMLQAMNTGHDGSLTTVHSNNPRDCVSRIETLVMFAGMELPSKAIREQISSAIDLVVQLNRFADGSRKITHITEVIGMEGQTITLQDIFLYKQKGIDKKGRAVGSFSGTGLIPSFLEKFKEQGIKLPQGLFMGKKKK